MTMVQIIPDLLQCTEKKNTLSIVIFPPSYFHIGYIYYIDGNQKKSTELEKYSRSSRRRPLKMHRPSGRLQEVVAHGEERRKLMTNIDVYKARKG